MILIQLLTTRERTPRDQLVNVGVTGVVRNVFIFQTRPGRAGDNFARLCLNIAEADLLVFFIQRQMRMVTTGKLAQGSPGFYSYLTIGFRCQRQDHLCCINCGIEHRLTFCRTFRFGVVELTQQIHLALGVPGNPFTAITDFLHQRADRGKAFVSRRIIALYDHNVRCSFTWDQVAFAFFPVFHIQRLRQFSGRVVLDRQRDDVGFFTQMADAHFGEFLRDGFVDFPIAFRFPGRIDRRRQRVNKRMHIRSIHVVFFVPGRRRQNDVGIETGARQTEVQRHHQIQLAFQTVVLPVHFFRLHAALLPQIFALDTVLRPQQVLEHKLMTFTGRTEQVRTPDEQITRVVFTVFRLFRSETDRTLFQGFHRIVHRIHPGFFRFASDSQRVSA